MLRLHATCTYQTHWNSIGERQQQQTDSQYRREAPVAKIMSAFRVSSMCAPLYSMPVVVEGLSVTNDPLNPPRSVPVRGVHRHRQDGGRAGEVDGAVIPPHHTGKRLVMMDSRARRTRVHQYKQLACFMREDDCPNLPGVASVLPASINFVGGCPHPHDGRVRCCGDVVPGRLGLDGRLESVGVSLRRCVGRP